LCNEIFVKHIATQNSLERGGNHTARRLLSWIVCLWLVLGVLPVTAENTGVAEYQLKAVFLYNFTKFTGWPTNAFAS
jgi:hypothetical protein